MLKIFTDWLTYTLFQFDPTSHWGESLNYFIYDSLKILGLVFGVVALIAFLRTFLPPHGIKKLLSKQKFGIGNLFAALFGAVTPFCSCSSIPLFLGFLKAEMPIGIAFSFLTTSPLVNEIVFVLMGDKFGWKIAFLYAASGILLGVFSGIILGKLKLEKEITLTITTSANLDQNYLPHTLEGKIEYSLRESYLTFQKLWWIILVGVGIGAIAHGYIPASFFEKNLNLNAWFAVPLATILGIPIYASCAAVVPFAVTIIEKGIPLGTALAFMMSLAGLSLPEAIMLKRMLSFKLLSLFFGIVGFGIICIGYLFNFLS